jgi:N-terminal acetyltransferase B complex catalytic subunit
VHKGYFVDLFVRASNKVAIEMYEKLGYSIYRTVNKYYSSSIDSSGEDAYGILYALFRYEKISET